MKNTLSWLPLLLLAAASTAHAQAPIRPATVAEQYLESAADQERSALHLPPLRRDPGLVEAATFQAEQMADHNEISHQFPGEPDLSARGATAGARFSMISENVGSGFSAAQVQSAWLRSEPHRRNMLDPSVDAVGIAVVARGRQLFAVEDFQRTVQSLPLEQQEKTIAALIVPYGVRILDANADARKSCSMSSGFSGSRQPLFVMRFSGANLTQLPDVLKTRLASGKYSEAAVGACALTSDNSFSGYSIAVLLYH